MQRGLGNASCGPAPLSKYIISAGKTYTQTFSILPLTKQTSDEEMCIRDRDYVGSVEKGKFADLVLWKPAFFGEIGRAHV